MSINKILLLVLSLGFISACADNLELQPAQSIGEDIALNTDANVKAVLIGAYDELGNGDLYGGNVHRNATLLGGTGEIQFVGTFNAPDEIARKNITVGNLDAQEHWLEAYETINITNNVIAALDVVNESDRDVVEGEARFIRALLYFDLLRFYGLPYASGGNNSQLGVPIITMPTRGITDESNVSRGTVEAGYTQVISDLETASSLLPSSNGFFATSGAAQALLARVFLQMGRFEDARDAANVVISSGTYSLTPSYAGAFMNAGNSVEDIFAMQVSTQDGVNNLNTFFSVPAFGGRDGDIEILPSHIARYEADDARLALFFGDGATYTGKYNDQFAVVSVIRLAEMYLIRAETNERLGTTVGATPAEDITTIRTRSGLNTDAVDLALILDERVRELAFEGLLIHDARRLQLDVGSLPYNDPSLVFPIPDREMNANPNLEQNPGY
ncbi:MAG: RagB/SusD family nutrient uptake outer membrane protein [Bacteroidota bacterium]